MVQALTKPVTFEEFMAWYLDTGKRYELHDGIILEIPKPTGTHSNVGVDLAKLSPGAI